MTFGKQNTEAEAHQILSYSFDQGVSLRTLAHSYAFLCSKRHADQWVAADPN